MERRAKGRSHDDCARFSATEAAKATGIAAGTIRSWMSRAKKAESEAAATDAGAAAAATQRRCAKTKVLAEQALLGLWRERADQNSRHHCGGAGDILGLIQSSVRLIKATMEDGPNSDEAKAGWLRALVGVMAQGVEKFQLFNRQATSRQAVEGAGDTGDVLRYHAAGHPAAARPHR